MEANEEGMNIIQENLAGFIFMCNRVTKPECYRYQVFGLPAGRKEVVEKINPGTYLFLFDTDVKLLYGIYMATSTGQLSIEALAFGGKFPAQVRFKIYEDCLPLPENRFKHAIQDNYQKNSNKFNPELNIRQVRSLLELFRPLHVSSTAPTQPVLNNIYSPSMLPLPPLHNVSHRISRPSLFEDAYLSRMSPNQAPRLLNYKHVNELHEPAGGAYPVHNLMPNSAAALSVSSRASRNQLHALASSLNPQPEGIYATGIGSSYTQSLSDPQYTHQNILNPRPEFHHSSMVNSGRDYAQSLPESQCAYHSVLHPQPEFYPSMTTIGSSLAQSLQDPQHPPPGFNFPVANVGSSDAQLLQDPRYREPGVLNLRPDSYSIMPNMGSSSYVQSLPDPQHTHHSLGHANVMMQSHASSSLYYPYVPHEVVPSMSSYQGS